MSARVLKRWAQHCAPPTKANETGASEPNGGVFLLLSSVPSSECSALALGRMRVCSILHNTIFGELKIFHNFLHGYPCRFIRDQHMRVIEREVRDLRIAFTGSPLVSPSGSTSKPSLASPTKSAPEPPSEVLARLSELSLQMRSLDARLASFASPVSTSSSPISPSTSTDEDSECCLCALLSRVRRWGAARGARHVRHTPAHRCLRRCARIRRRGTRSRFASLVQ